LNPAAFARVSKYMHSTLPAAPTSGIKAAAPPASEGRFFGFSGRSARGDTALGTVVEGAVDVPIKKYWSINAYGGVMSAGDVVTNWFTDKRLLFWSVENVLRF
jgi:hypothetical protein